MHPSETIAKRQPKGKTIPSCEMSLHGGMVIDLQTGITAWLAGPGASTCLGKCSFLFSLTYLQLKSMTLKGGRGKREGERKRERKPVKRERGAEDGN